MAVYNNETYSCSCERPVSDDYDELMKFNWTCPICNKKIRVTFNLDGKQHIVIRKRAGKLKKYNMVFYIDWKYHEILGISEVYNDDSKVYLRLRGFGGVPVPKNEYLECALSGND